MANTLLTDSLLVPLGGAKAAGVDIDSGTGNLTIDGLARGEHVLAAGTLQYFEAQGVPSRTVNADHGRATLALKAGTRAGPRSWFRLPWAACAGGTQWQLHLNPTVPSAITAHSDGGNVRLDLAGMMVSRLAAETGGGNMEVVLPDHAAGLSVAAKTGGGNVTVAIGSGSTGSTTVDATSGAGNVVVRVPRGLAARVHARSGLGKVIVASRFTKTETERDTYQSPDYDAAVDRVEITAHSGAGNVSVDMS
jgi:hypothetical protein